MKKKTPAKQLRIPKGEFSCGYETVASIVENLIDVGFSLADFRHAEIELSYDGCYYESDTPSVVVRWKDIFET